MKTHGKYVIFGIFGCIFTVVGISLYREKQRLSSYGTHMNAPVYADTMYASNQKCINRKSPVKFDDISWRVVETHTQIPDISQSWLGLWEPTTKTIYLVKEAVNDTTIIRHELMHAALHPTGGHPYFAFNERCNTSYLLIDFPIVWDK